MKLRCFSFSLQESKNTLVSLVGDSRQQKEKTNPTSSFTIILPFKSNLFLVFRQSLQLFFLRASLQYNTLYQRILGKERQQDNTWKKNKN